METPSQTAPSENASWTSAGSPVPDAGSAPREDAAQLRQRLLRMIVANERLRKPTGEDAGKRR